MPPKRPPGLGLSPAFDPDKLKSFDDHDEYHPAPKCASEAEPISAIIPGKLYIGSVKDLANLAGLRAMGITHIINVAREVETVPEQKPSPGASSSKSGINNSTSPSSNASRENSGAAAEGIKLVESSTSQSSAVEGSMEDAQGEQSFTATLSGDVSNFQWLHVPLRDGVNKDTAGGIDLAVAHVEQAIEAGGTVLVHCRRGISRSAAVVVAFVMRHGTDLARPAHWTYVDSVAYVKSRRAVISLNLEFRVVLELRCEEIRLRREAAAAAAASSEMRQQQKEDSSDGMENPGAVSGGIKKKGKTGFGDDGPDEAQPGSSSSGSSSSVAASSGGKGNTGVSFGDD